MFVICLCYMHMYCSSVSLENTGSLTIRFSNLLYASASPGLICGHCLVSLWYKAITLCGFPYNWCWYIFPLEEALCNFWPSPFFPSGIFGQLCELSTWVFNFLFDSFIEGRKEIVKLQWVSTKHISISGVDCWFTSLYIISATLISLVFSSGYLHIADIWHTGFSCNHYQDQCHIWHHHPFTSTGVKMIVLSFWGDILEQDLLYMITDF